MASKAEQPDKSAKTTTKTVTKKITLKKSPLKSALKIVYWLLLFGIAVVVGSLLFDAYWTYYSNTR